MTPEMSACEALPLVSCIIATHNRKEIVCRAIDSLIGQMYPKIEVIVVADGCADGTEEHIAERYDLPNEHMKLLINERSLGPSGARNRGLYAAKGEYLSFLDDDDEWLPHKIQSQMEYARQGYDLVTCTRAIYVLNGRASVYGASVKAVSLSKMFRRNQIISVSPLVRTNLMKSCPFDPDLFVGEDYDVWVRLLHQGVNTVNINEPLVRYHKESECSLNRTRLKKYHGRMKFYTKHKNKMDRLHRLHFILMTIMKYMVPDPRYYVKKVSHAPQRKSSLNSKATEPRKADAFGGGSDTASDGTVC